MAWFAIMEGATEVSRVFVLSEDDLALQLRDGQTAALSEHPYMQQPNVAVADTIEDLREARWGEAKAYRDMRANSTCNTPVGVVQTDDSSKLRINGAVNMAMLAKSSGQDFSVDWTLNDNSIVTLSADMMIALGIAVGQFVAACQNAGTAIRAEIEAATDAEALQAIDITANYPE